MPQFARPNADTTLGNYSDQAGGTANIFTAINEVTANDANYVRSPAAPVNEVYVCKLSSLIDPLASTGHIMRMRTATDLANQQALDFTQQLRQGYVSEASQGTLIASQSRTSVTSTTFTDSVYTLTGAEADAITDYTSLYFRFIINKP